MKGRRSQSPKITRRLLVLIGLFAVVLPACGRETPTREKLASRPPPTTSPISSPSPTPTSPSSTVQTTRTVPAVVSCDPASILPVLEREFDGDHLRIVRAEVKRCRNGYAQVFAIPDQSLCPGGSHCLENEQVFLQKVGGRWRIIDYGTGIACEQDYGLSPKTKQACKALGYKSPSLTPRSQGARQTRPASPERCGDLPERVTDIGAVDATCDTARTVARGYDRMILGGGTFPGSSAVAVGDYTCRARRTGAETFSVRCAHSSRLVTFDWGV